MLPRPQRHREDAAIRAKGEGSRLILALETAGERPSRLRVANSTIPSSACPIGACRKSFAVGAPGQRGAKSARVHGKRHFARLDVIDPQQSNRAPANRRFPSGLNATDKAHTLWACKVRAFWAAAVSQTLTFHHRGRRGNEFPLGLHASACMAAKLDLNRPQNGSACRVPNLDCSPIPVDASRSPPGLHEEQNPTDRERRNDLASLQIGDPDRVVARRARLPSGLKALGSAAGPAGNLLALDASQIAVPGLRARRRPPELAAVGVPIQGLHGSKGTASDESVFPACQSQIRTVASLFPHRTSPCSFCRKSQLYSIPSPSPAASRRLPGSGRCSARRPRPP